MIIQNAIKIIDDPKEEKFIVSFSRHHFSQYRFADNTTIFTDGGLDYVRRGGSAFDDGVSGKCEGKWIDWCLTESSPFDLVKERLLWGTSGKDGTQPVKYVRLMNCETSHLKAILVYKFPNGSEINDIYRKVICQILSDRGI